MGLCSYLGVRTVEWVKNRYMFDTSALDRLCKSTGDDELKIYASKQRGFEYYFTETQLQEAEDNIHAKKYAGLDEVGRDAAMRAIQMLRMVSKIQKAYVGRIATLDLNRWVGNGTFQLLPENERAAHAMYLEMIGDNPDKYYNDAIIALTGIVNGCTLVVEDKRFRNAVNRHFSGRAIRYGEFLARL